MNALDVLLALAVAAPAAWGLWKGAVEIVAGPAAFVAAAVGSLALFEPLGRLMLPDSPYGPLVGLGVGFIGVYLLVRLLGAGVRRLLAGVGLGWIDHLAGGLAVAAVGGLVASWMVTGAGLVLPEPPQVFRGGILVPYARLLACNTGLPCGPAADSLDPGPMALLEAFEISGAIAKR